MQDLILMMGTLEFWFLAVKGVLVIFCILVGGVILAGAIGYYQHRGDRPQLEYPRGNNRSNYDPSRHLERLCIYYGHRMGQQLFAAGYDERCHPK